jgi:aminomethyltransferase
MAEPKRTPLFAQHQSLGARLIDFGGWMMPVQYAGGIIKEHEATRAAVGVFDVSHMGEVHFRGPAALAAVQRLVTNDVGRLEDGRALYTVACLPSGGIVDDLIVYRVARDHVLIVVNATNIDKDLAWFRQNTTEGPSTCTITDASPETALLAFQGPKAELALQPLTPAALGGLRSFSFLVDTNVAGRAATIARTGYTGEDGFEIFCASADAPAVWAALVEAAGAHGGGPVGLGARDTLRLEARLSLYGNDITEETTPLEAGLGWVVKLDGLDFIGKEALVRQKAEGVRRRLVGFVMRGRGIARHGYPIHAPAADGGLGPRLGEVTSGTYGPTVEKAVGLGYVAVAQAEPGQRLAIDCRGKAVEAEITKGAFYTRARKN